jgi:hypothetical protein
MTLEIPYPEARSHYTREEDRWLVCMTNECGYMKSTVWLDVRRQTCLAVKGKALTYIIHKHALFHA